MRLIVLFILCCCAMLTTPRQPSANPVCTCETVKRTDGWCEICNVGYLAGIKIESAMFFDLLDAHGHQIDPSTLACDNCKTLYPAHGFCPSCKVGFVNKQLYFSKLTYYLARGEVNGPEPLACATCLKNTEKSGWCDVCKRGMVGQRSYRIREEFEEAADLRMILVDAIPLAKRCLSCALSLINNGTCLKCRKTFQDGHLVPAGKP